MTYPELYAMIGQKLGPYEITGKVGEGGMGVVWKARDARLNRDVAIKVLPTSHGNDPARRQRFLQEAHAASALNHPNIVTIYDAGNDWIAMELVPGLSLAQKINGEPLRTKDAIDYAKQISSALAAAHDAGILHRDLKPSNLMVTPDGRVKILDFGLAKLIKDGAPGPNDATKTLALTQSGAIVGTFAYMSPEQAQDQKLDARSDIFSFGAVLYEMVTGQKAFQRESAASTLSAVLRDDPAPAPALDRVVARCLEKNPARRFQHAADIQWALDAESGSATSAGAAAVEAPPRSRSWIAIAAAAFALGAAAMGAIGYLRRAPAPVAGYDETRLTFKGSVHGPALSLDGNDLAYAWTGDDGKQWDLYVKRIGGGPPQRITNDPRREISAAWAPDAKRLAFAAVEGGRDAIYIASLLGGAPRKLAEFAARGNQKISWSGDGRWLAYTCERKICLIHPETGETKAFSKPAGSPDDREPAFAPDSRSLAFIRYRSFANAAIIVVPVDEKGDPGEERTVTGYSQAIRSLTWSSDGKRLIACTEFGSRASLQSVPATGGGFERLPVDSGRIHDLTAIRAGRLAFVRVTLLQDILRLDLKNGAADGAPRPITSGFSESGPHLSPDRSRLVFSSNRSGELEIWHTDPDGGQPVQLTNLAESTGSPSWSPDGSQVVFDSYGVERGHVYLVGREGGTPRRLPAPTESCNSPSWSRDGSWIYAHCAGEIVKYSLKGGPPAPAGIKSLYAKEALDGQHVYFTRDGRLWRKPKHGGDEMPVAEDVSPARWALGSRHVYWFRISKPGDLVRVPLTGGTPTIVWQVPASRAPAAGPGLTVAEDESVIYFKENPEPDTEIKLIEGFR